MMVLPIFSRPDCRDIATTCALMGDDRSGAGGRFQVRSGGAPREGLFMHNRLLARLAPLAAGALIAMTATAFAQAPAEPDRPVTPPDSYRVVMENDRVRIIEVHIKAHSKVDVDSPANRDRFLYMLSDGALILAQPGKTPYEFALHAGETAVFPAVSPTVENDTDSPVRALMVEVKEGARAAGGRSKGRQFAKRGARTKFAGKSATKSKSVKSAARSKPKTKHAAKIARPKAASKSVKLPLNLSKANARPSKKKVTGKGRGSES
jgi:hypothetical protein